MKRSVKRIFATVMTVIMILCVAPLNGFVGLELPAWMDFSTKASAEDSMSIGGKVWIDQQYGEIKSGDYVPQNGIIDSFEETLVGSKVSLFNSNNEQIICDKDGNVYGDNGTIIINETGLYSFNNLPAGSYYVLFEYDGINYQALDKNWSLDGNNNGDNKAVELNREQLAFNFSTIKKNYTATGIALNYSITDNVNITDMKTSKINVNDEEGVIFSDYAAKAKSDIVVSSNSNVNLGVVTRFFDLALRFAVDSVIVDDKTISYYQLYSDNGVTIYSDSEVFINYSLKVLEQSFWNNIQSDISVYFDDNLSFVSANYTGNDEAVTSQEEPNTYFNNCTFNTLLLTDVCLDNLEHCAEIKLCFKVNKNANIFSNVFCEISSYSTEDGLVDNDSAPNNAIENAIFVSEDDSGLFNNEKNNLKVFPDGFEYEISENVAKITNYHGNKEFIYIPSEIEGIPVTTIGSNAFTNNLNGAKKIIIPSSIITIEEAAIGGSSDTGNASLESIEICEGLQQIGSLAFYNCSNLSTINIPETVSQIIPTEFQGVYLYSGFLSCGIYLLGDAPNPSLRNVYIKQHSYVDDYLKNIHYYERDDNPFKDIINYNYSEYHSVNYNCYNNGGDWVTTITRSAKNGDEIDLSLQSSKYGWDFVGWNTDPNATIGLSTLSMSSNDVTLYAIYNKTANQTHSVTYNYSYNGGTSSTKTTDIIEEGTAIDLTPTATKSGWTFVGWNTDKNATTALTSLTMGSENVTLYAIYKKTLTGTFIDYSGSSKTTRTASVAIYNQATQGEVSPPSQNTYTGWTKGGWTKATTPDATAVSNFIISSNTTFYGLYTKTITLSYNANGGTPTPPSQTGTQYVNSYLISNVKNPSFTLAGPITRTGLLFSKWAMNSTGGVKYDAGETITINTDTTMYATWKIDAIPSVVTNAATDITKNAATLSGRITSDGGNTITSRKIVYYEKLNSSSKYTVDVDESFTAQVTNLKPSTEYWFQAIAESAKGTGSGEVLSFKTKDEQIVLPNKITVSPTYVSIVKGKTRTLLATVLPSNANNRSVSWSSDNETVATVVDGVVYARSKGSAKITVKTNANGLTAVCYVNVTEIDNYTNFDFSEINMGTNCSYLDPEGFIREPHKGGNAKMATAYLARWDGAVLEKNDRYPSNNVVYREVSADYHVQDVLWIPYRKNAQDNGVIKQTIMNYGAITANFEVDWNYFNSNRSTYYLPSSASNDDNGWHAIAIVGWDDNYSKYNFKSTPSGNGAFICKNSWGTDSGENGYFYISYYDTSIGYSHGGTMAAYINLETNTNYNKIYQYDPLGAVSVCGFNNTIWSTNVFPEQGYTLSSDEKLSAASFYTYDKGTSYELYVVKDYTGEESLSQSRELVSSGVIEYPGYHTIPFKEIPLKAGTRFAIVVKMSLPNQYVYSCYEAPVSDKYRNAKSNQGESFYSSNGSSWHDLTTYMSNANFCIKAFTNANPTKRGAVLMEGIDNSHREYEDETVFTIEEFVAAGGIISDEYLDWYYNNISEDTINEDDGLGFEPETIGIGDNDIEFVEGASFPTKYDLRSENCVSSVKDQGALGLCWSFAAYASLESCLLKKKESMSAEASIEGLDENDAIDTLINSSNVELNGISLENEYVLKIGEQKILDINLSPKNAAYPSLIWSSTDNSIISVDTSGMVTGKMAGTAMVEVSTEDGAFRTYCYIRVVGIEALSTANIDYNKNLISGLETHINSLDQYIRVTDDTCRLQYQSLGTDGIVYLTRDSEIIETYSVVIFGDVNGDGWYDGQDSFIVNCIANGLLTHEQVGEAKWMAADCNHDGEINATDVAILEQAGLLLANVDQTKSQEELLETDSYIEYLNLIDQNPAANEEINEDPINDESSEITFLQKLVDFFKIIINFIRSFIVK